MYDKSYHIKKILSDYNLETVFRLDSKLDNMIKLSKDPLDNLDQCYLQDYLWTMQKDIYRSNWEVTSNKTK